MIKRKKPFIVRKKKRRKSGEITLLKKNADRLMSLWVRQKSADSDGNVTCYTCPYTAHWKKMQNGHLVSRFYMETRYDERNCRSQCYTCNMWRNGMTPHFAARLQIELGNGIVEDLYEKARISRIYPASFFEEKIAHYTQLLSNLNTPQE